MSTNEVIPNKRPRSPEKQDSTEPDSKKPKTSVEGFKQKTPEELAKEALERARRAEELQRKIQEKLAQIQQPKTLSASKVILDEKGNLVDASGNIIRVPNRPVVSTLANVKRQNELRKKKLKIIAPKKVKQSIESTQFFDPNVPTPRFVRQKRGFNFVEQGKFIREANKLRAYQAKKQQLREQQRKLQEQAKNKEDGDKMDIDEQKAEDAMETDDLIDRPIIDLLAIKREKKKDQVAGEPHLRIGFDSCPLVEWWDEPLLPHKSYEDVTGDKFLIKEKLVCNVYIEHPVPIPPAVESKSKPLPLLLTKKERKKLRTQTRLQREKEKQQKIKLGLIPPPPPKANLKSFMRVHLQAGIEDPTQLEKRIRKEIEQRIQNHQARNEANKLTPQERKEKKRKKAQEDAQKELRLVLFKVDDISHPQNRFKVNANANDLHISGCVLTAGKITIIIAEAGQKALRKFKHILLNRIDWNKQLDGTTKTDDETDKTPKNKCTLIWEGVQKKRNFKYFKFQQFSDDETARKYLKDHGVGHLWDFATNSVAEETSAPS